jgi:hypothetical protein
VNGYCILFNFVVSTIMLMKILFSYSIFMKTMQAHTVVVEQDATTGLYIAYIPGLPGAHIQGETLQELHSSLEEVVALVEGL